MMMIIFGDMVMLKMDNMIKMVSPWQGHTILQCDASFFCSSTHLVMMMMNMGMMMVMLVMMMM